MAENLSQENMIITGGIWEEGVEETKCSAKEYYIS